jgi:hypothetical protein
MQIDRRRSKNRSDIPKEMLRCLVFLVVQHRVSMTRTQLTWCNTMNSSDLDSVHQSAFIHVERSDVDVGFHSGLIE